MDGTPPQACSYLDQHTIAKNHSYKTQRGLPEVRRSPFATFWKSIGSSCLQWSSESLHSVTSHGDRAIMAPLAQVFTWKQTWVPITDGLYIPWILHVQNLLLCSCLTIIVEVSKGMPLPDYLCRSVQQSSGELSINGIVLAVPLLFDSIPAVVTSQRSALIAQLLSSKF